MNRIPGAFATLALLALNAGIPSGRGADNYPASDPPLPKLAEPAQTQEPSVYSARRQALMKEMGEGVAVIFAQGKEDNYGYRQSSDFFYLTGVNEEGAALVLAPKEHTYREFLLLPSRDPEAERWTGERESIGGKLRQEYGFEKIYRAARLESLVTTLCSHSPICWQLALANSELSEQPMDLELYGKIGKHLAEVSTHAKPYAIARMRSRHSPDEIALMQRAVRISEAGFRAALPEIHPGGFEGAVAAEAERVWKEAGARRPAYASIVGSGPNSTILHYPRAERIMRDGDLLLMDMAADYAHYAADITRTVPVNGKFSPEQRKIYELVLKAQTEAFHHLKPGVYHEDIDAIARKVITDAGYGDYFIHGLGHFVGLDVHDAGAYHEPLEAGMVITLEPGIYIPDKQLGVRIEDDVLITPTGAKFLSDGLPRDPDEIEKWMASGAVKQK
jgi:Xaa-Pro aminopeptidase